MIIKLKYRFRRFKYEQSYEDVFEFDTEKYRNDENNYYNVISDYLQDLYGQAPAFLHIENPSNK